MRVRAFELRLIAIALVACWSVAAGLVLLAYRPGGPLDLIVGLTAMTPIAIALAGAVWPPVARGDVAFPAIVALGVLALLCLVPSIAGVVTQLLAYGSRTPPPPAAPPTAAGRSYPRSGPYPRGCSLRLRPACPADSGSPADSRAEPPSDDGG